MCVCEECVIFVDDCINFGRKERWFFFDFFFERGSFIVFDLKKGVDLANHGLSSMKGGLAQVLFVIFLIWLVDYCFLYILCDGLEDEFYFFFYRQKGCGERRLRSRDQFYHHLTEIYLDLWKVSETHFNFCYKRKEQIVLLNIPKKSQNKFNQNPHHLSYNLR